jgi:multiple sugar transport system substrate-binding protein
MALWVMLITVLIATACGGGAPATQAGGAGEAVPGTGAVTIRYGLWDSAQLPAYEQCAAAFQEKNPNITIAIEQAGWDDYWNSIQTGFVSGNAPDVFTNHLAKYPEFAVKAQIVDIQPMVDRDQVDTGQYIEGLAGLWVREGKRYGLPKDWDTIAVFYNKDMLDQAGVDPAIMKEWTWNPQDGGTYEQTIAQLTLDDNGNNGLSPDFDKNNVVQFGFIHEGGGGFAGQTQWSMYAASNGFKFIDEPWGSKYYYDDPKLIETMDWYSSLIEKGYAPKEEEVTSLGAAQLFFSGKGALITEGSWNVGNFLTNSSFPVGFGLLPIGPEGRKSMFNGLADSIWVGSQHQEEAWQWVKFLGSQECQDTVGSTGVVFPAIQSGVEKSLQVRKDNGIDVSAFTDQALDPNGTFLFPITDNGAEITSIMIPTMESIMLFQAEPADILPEANAKVNALFE